MSTWVRHGRRQPWTPRGPEDRRSARPTAVGDEEKETDDGLDPDGPGRRLWAPALDLDPVDVDPREPRDRGPRRDALAPPDRDQLRAAAGRPTRPRSTCPRVAPGPPHVVPGEARPVAGIVRPGGCRASGTCQRATVSYRPATGWPSGQGCRRRIASTCRTWADPCVPSPTWFASTRTRSRVPRLRSGSTSGPGSCSGSW